MKVLDLTVLSDKRVTSEVRYGTEEAEKKECLEMDLNPKSGALTEQECAEPANGRRDGFGVSISIRY